MSSAPDVDHWTSVADEWIAWARAPGHDHFWAYRSALAAFVGAGAGAALEVGCGEGRVSRLLRECGYRVTASDPVEALLAAARDADSANAYVSAQATDLPFDDCAFDLVVAYNTLMDIEYVPAAVAEMRRVMRTSGLLVISVVHPFVDRGRFADDAGDAPLVFEESYFGERRFQSVEESGGLTMHFAGWSRPLGYYVAALAEAGLAVTSLSEPTPEPRPAPLHLERWSRHPLFLWMKAKRLPDPD